MTMRPIWRGASAAVLVAGCVSAANAQPAAPPGLTLDDIVVREQPQSNGRGAPLPPVPETLVGTELKGLQGGMGPPIKDGRAIVAAENGATPAGVQALPRDIFNSDDFYVDRDLWMDPAYYRCNSPRAIEGIWGAYEAPSLGDNPPETISWGFCDRDYPRDQMVSPYSYTTAQEHYEALLGEATERGGPTIYTYENPPPNWNGVFSANGFGQYASTRSWMSAQLSQVPTYLSLLTPEYQLRMVQQTYHQAHNHIAWPGAYCWPDGFERRWFRSSEWVMVTPDLVQTRNRVNEAIVTDIYVNRSFKMDGSVPNLSGDVRQWVGDTIGFWDGDALITWTSNIKAWIGHGWFETSGLLQSIEIYTPIDDKQGNFVGLVHEAVLYDPEAFVEPLRVVERWQRTSTLADAPRPLGWSLCFPSLFPIDGLQTPVNAGDIIQYRVPDMNGRPWADIWEEFFEQDMQRPEKTDVLADF